MKSSRRLALSALAFVAAVFATMALASPALASISELSRANPRLVALSCRAGNAFGVATIDYEAGQEFVEVVTNYVAESHLAPTYFGLADADQPTTLMLVDSVTQLEYKLTIEQKLRFGQKLENVDAMFWQTGAVAGRPRAIPQAPDVLITAATCSIEISAR